MGEAMKRDARFDKLETIAYEIERQHFYYAVDYEGWRTHSARSLEAVRRRRNALEAAYIENAHRLVGEDVFEAALQGVVNPKYGTSQRTDRAEHSFAVEALCLATGRCMAFTNSEYDEFFELLEDELRCPVFGSDGLPFGLPTSFNTPWIEHSSTSYLQAHLKEVHRLLQAGFLDQERDMAVRYRDNIKELVSVGLGLVHVIW